MRSLHRFGLSNKTSLVVKNLSINLSIQVQSGDKYCSSHYYVILHKFPLRTKDVNKHRITIYCSIFHLSSNSVQIARRRERMKI